jgi:glutathione S-transferase
MTPTPILWTFRRCPYAIRARLAIRSAGVPVRLHEVLLREKPDAFLAASPSGTVPCLQTETVIDESRDIMNWALSRNDPEGWLADAAAPLIDQCDGPFKLALDHTKYHVRYPDLDPAAEREKAATILRDWNAQLTTSGYLLGDRMSLADAALLPFVRQFANTDRNWFDDQDWPALARWLRSFEQGDAFAAVMPKLTPWQPGEDGVPFP